MTPNDKGEIEQTALNALTRLERRIWGSAIRSQVWTPGSRFWRNYDRYGPDGAAELSIAMYWLGPASLNVPLIFVVVAVAGNNDSTPAVVFLFGLDIFFVAVGSVRAQAAALAGRTFREEKGASSE